MTDEVKKQLKEINVDPVIIPGGCIKYIQAPDEFRNKPFKTKVTELHSQWLSEGVHQYTEGGNIKAPSRKRIVEWILGAWSQLPKESIIKSFKCWQTMVLKMTTSIAIKKCQPCAAGMKKLNSQLLCHRRR